MVKVKSCFNPVTVKFQQLGIERVQREEIRNSLAQRKQIRVDPFRQGFEHVDDDESIDLAAVKLCFQVCIWHDLD